MTQICSREYFIRREQQGSTLSRSLPRAGHNLRRVRGVVRETEAAAVQLSIPWDTPMGDACDWMNDVTFRNLTNLPELI